MFSHVMVGADDIAASKAFYDAALGALGIPANGSTIGFAAASPEAADAWHAAGLANGGTAIENPPGIRHGTAGRTLYLAYLRDPAGNKLCASHRIA